MQRSVPQCMKTHMPGPANSWIFLVNFGFNSIFCANAGFWTQTLKFTESTGIRQYWNTATGRPPLCHKKRWNRPAKLPQKCAKLPQKPSNSRKNKKDGNAVSTCFNNIVTMIYKLLETARNAEIHYVDLKTNFVWKFTEKESPGEIKWNKDK